MAKIIAPPAIQNLDGFLDMLLHPDKYEGYMKQLKEMKDAIVEHLGTMATKEQADAALAQANAKLSEANTALAQAKKAVEQAHAECCGTRDETDAYANAAKQKADALLASATKKDHDIAEKSAVLHAREQAVSKREMMADALEADLKQRRATLDDEYDKLRKKKDLLAEIN